ncbi:CATRA conflict system CASPASE/TPR repeat-associated protein [Streptomyces sp. RKAG293]|uniref:CATRA conflict system CASPASE/TPR repeat-associated protein n=1 Tax=Streptomyces sp. RKAG293 TaxID=2893403 RepID=UPI00203454F1|nr:CATRA conflict system CASPASE/TPR repeat-associated protein [Streptomyces sp. RKAG293]MCM2422183.1 glycosyltransferase family 4 protein [Streptomyces sp. RKAG293]
MPESAVAEQEIATHVFIPLDGVRPSDGFDSVAGMWNRFRERQGADHPVSRGVPADLPDVLPVASLHGSVPLAAVQSAGGLDQAVLRRNQEVLNLSLLLGAAPGRTWPDLEQRVQEITGPLGQAHLGAVTLLLGKTAGSKTDVLESASPYGTGDTDPVRRLRLLVPAGHDDRLGAWAWSAGDGTEMPLFVRYLMHMSAIRYQIAVHGMLRSDWALSDGPAPKARIRVPFATGSGPRDLEDPVEQLSALRQSVEGAWHNASQALRTWDGSRGSALACTDVLDDDGELVAWFTRMLKDDVTLHHLGKRQPVPEVSTTPESQPATPTGPERERSPHGNTEIGTRTEPVRVLSVADEWFPARGGLSTLNRLLCIALANARADVVVLVLTSSEQERADARTHGIRLLDVARTGYTGREALMLPPQLPEGWVPDLILGHGRVTGPAALAQVRHFPGAKRLQFLHVEPDQAEWHRTRPEGDVGARADERTELEFTLCRGAWRTVAVGPRLEAALVRRRRVPGFEDLGPLLRLDPGFDAGPTALGSPPPDTVPQILVLGRLGEEIGKGLDIACRAVGRAVPERSRPGRWQLVVRGARDGQSPDLHTRATRWVDQSAVDLSVLPYNADPRQIQRDVAGAALVLMPSRAESFGLVGLEAVVAGVPVLVSGRSGLGELLRRTLPDHEAERVVVDVEAVPHRIEQDVGRWAGAISSVMFDLRGAFLRAEELQKEMAYRVPWGEAARRVLRCVRETDHQR